MSQKSNPSCSLPFSLSHDLCLSSKIGIFKINQKSMSGSHIRYMMCGDGKKRRTLDFNKSYIAPELCALSLGVLCLEAAKRKCWTYRKSLRQSNVRKNQGQLSIPRYKKSIVSDRARAQGKIIESKKERKKVRKKERKKERKRE